MAESKYLQATPQYKAMSLDDRMRHVALYKPEYEKQQDAYDKLLEDTLILENLKGSDIDADLYRQYSQWRGKLVGDADALLNTGKLDMQSVRDLRRQYLNELKPMEDKYKHRNTLIAQQAAKATPYTIYDKDYSKTAVQDISLDDAVRSVDLSNIEKQAYEDAVSRYMDTGLPDDTDPDIERLLEGTDLSGYSEDTKGRVTDSIRKGYYKAGVSIHDYLKQRERAIKQDAYQELQEERLRKLIDRNPGGDDYNNGDINPFNPTRRNPAAGREPVKIINGNAGDQIPVYKLTDKRKDYYFVMRGKDPVLIDSSIIGEDGSVDYTSFYKTVYGEPKSSYYDGREYFIGMDGKINSNIGNYTSKKEYMIRSSDELKDFLQNNPEYAGTLLQVAKERYDTKDVLNSNILNFKDICVRVYEPNNKDAYPKSKVAISLKEKSGSNERFTLIDGLAPAEENAPEDPTPPADTARVQGSSAPQGVGNMVMN